MRSLATFDARRHRITCFTFLSFRFVPIMDISPIQRPVEPLMRTTTTLRTRASLIQVDDNDDDKCGGLSVCLDAGCKLFAHLHLPKEGAINV